VYDVARKHWEYRKQGFALVHLETGGYPPFRKQAAASAAFDAAEKMARLSAICEPSIVPEREIVYGTTYRGFAHGQ
jgi:hypothetical protein